MYRKIRKTQYFKYKPSKSSKYSIHHVLPSPHTPQSYKSRLQIKRTKTRIHLSIAASPKSSPESEKARNQNRSASYHVCGLDARVTSPLIRSWCPKRVPFERGEYARVVHAQSASRQVEVCPRTVFLGLQRATDTGNELRARERRGQPAAIPFTD